MILVGSISSASYSSDRKSDPSNPFHSDYLSLEIAGHYPVAHTQRRLSPYQNSWYLAYNHFLNQSWNVGLSVGFKSFLRKDNGQELAFFSVSNHSLYIIRLYHPTYLMVGSKIQYLTPNEKAGFPINKSPDFETEIAVAATLQLAHTQGPIIYTFRIDRWRGTKTNRFHGFEVAMGVNYYLN